MSGVRECAERNRRQVGLIADAGGCRPPCTPCLRTCAVALGRRVRLHNKYDPFRVAGILGALVPGVVLAAAQLV